MVRKSSRLESERRRTEKSEDAAKRIAETSAKIAELFTVLGADEMPQVETLGLLLVSMETDALLVTDEDARTRLLAAEMVYSNIAVAEMMVRETPRRIASAVSREVFDVAGAVMRGEKQPAEMKETLDYKDLIEVKFEEWDQNQAEARRQWREEQSETPAQ